MLGTIYLASLCLCPASSTVGTSTDTAPAVLPNPKKEPNKHRRVTPPEKPPQSPALHQETEALRPAPADHLPSSDDTSPRPKGSPATHKPSTSSSSSSKIQAQTSPSRDFWGWTKAGTGRTRRIGRIPHLEWESSTTTAKAATTVMNGAPTGQMTESWDDFSVPLCTTSEPDDETRREGAAAARLDGSGSANSAVDAMFSQTKGSSDELAASANGTPSPTTRKNKQRANSVECSAPTTPSPAQRNKLPGTSGTAQPTSHPTYKIALAADFLSRHSTAST